MPSTHHRILTKRPAIASITAPTTSSQAPSAAMTLDITTGQVTQTTSDPTKGTTPTATAPITKSMAAPLPGMTSTSSAVVVPTVPSPFAGTTGVRPVASAGSGSASSSSGSQSASNLLQNSAISSVLQPSTPVVTTSPSLPPPSTPPSHSPHHHLRLGPDLLLCRLRLRQCRKRKRAVCRSQQESLLAAAENDPRLRSPLVNILNVAQRLRLRCCHRLRPRRMTVLSSRF